MIASELTRSIKTFGVVKTSEDLMLRAVNRAAFVKILKGIKVEKVDPEYLRCDSKYRGQFFDHTMLMELAEDPQNELSEGFLLRAIEKETNIMVFSMATGSPRMVGTPGGQPISTRRIWCYISAISMFTCTKPSRA